MQGDRIQGGATFKAITIDGRNCTRNADGGQLRAILKRSLLDVGDLAAEGYLAQVGAATECIAPHCSGIDTDAHQTGTIGKSTRTDCVHIVKIGDDC
jgi:hypothetical protein